jgi:hypothetical protein
MIDVPPSDIDVVEREPAVGMQIVQDPTNVFLAGRAATPAIYQRGRDGLGDQHRWYHDRLDTDRCPSEPEDGHPAEQHGDRYADPYKRAICVPTLDYAGVLAGHAQARRHWIDRRPRRLIAHCIRFGEPLTKG